VTTLAAPTIRSSNPLARVLKAKQIEAATRGMQQRAEVSGTRCKAIQDLLAENKQGVGSLIRGINDAAEAAIKSVASDTEASGREVAAEAKRAEKTMTDMDRVATDLEELVMGVHVVPRLNKVRKGCKNLAVPSKRSPPWPTTIRNCSRVS